MKFTSDISVGDRITAVKYNRHVSGKVVSILPGGVVIINDNNDEREVVDIDRVKQIMTQKDDEANNKS